MQPDTVFSKNDSVRAPSLRQTIQRSIAQITRMGQTHSIALLNFPQSARQCTRFDILVIEAKFQYSVQASTSLPLREAGNSSIHKLQMSPLMNKSLASSLYRVSSGFAHLVFMSFTNWRVSLRRWERACSQTWSSRAAHWDKPTTQTQTTEVATLTKEDGVTYRELTKARVPRVPTLVPSCVTSYLFGFWQLTTEIAGLHKHGECGTCRTFLSRPTRHESSQGQKSTEVQDNKNSGLTFKAKWSKDINLKTLKRQCCRLRQPLTQWCEAAPSSDPRRSPPSLFPPQDLELELSLSFSRLARTVRQQVRDGNLASHLPCPVCKAEEPRHGMNSRALLSTPLMEQSSRL